MKTKSVAVMATIPSRLSIVRKVVDTICPQVDLFHIVFNDYLAVPEWIKDYSKVIPYLNTEKEYKATAVWKVKDILPLDSYIHIIDDDIVYPVNYITKVREKLDKYDKKAVITVHGYDIKEPFKSYINDTTYYFFMNNLLEDRRVHIAGVGTTSFHSSLFNFCVKDVAKHMSRDLGFAIQMAKKNVSIVCIERKKLWLSKIKIRVGAARMATFIHKSPDLVDRKNTAIVDELIPLLVKNGVYRKNNHEKS